MAHQILYDYVGGPDENFRTLRVLWEPYTNRVSLRFRNCHEAANGLVASPEDMVRYLDIRKKSGPPWDEYAPREARRRIASLVGEDLTELRGAE